ncbi:hypothetical protein BH11CYA1_BH11CYA1_44040 [soil metagenome]
MKPRLIVLLLLGLTAIGCIAFAEHSRYLKMGYLSPDWQQLAASDYLNSSNVSDVTIIDGKIVLLCETASEWNTTKSEVVPFVLEGSNLVYTICQDRSGNIAALCKAKEAIVVMRRLSNKWVTLSVPAIVAAKPDSFKLAVDGNEIALASATQPSSP